MRDFMRIKDKCRKCGINIIIHITLKDWLKWKLIERKQKPICIGCSGR